MSTKTNFKRIALVAIAALGMGVLSSVPSQAVIPATFTLTAGATAGTATAGSGTASDSSTGATVTVSFLAVTANTDSITLTVSPKSKPTAGTYPKALLTLADTSSSTTAPVIRLETASSTPINAGVGQGAVIVSTNATTGSSDSGTAAQLASAEANRYVTATFKVHMDSITTRVAGTYVFTVIATPFDAATSQAGVSANVKTVDVSITVSVGATTVSSAYSRATLTQGSTFSGVSGSSDSTVSVPMTASTIAKAVIRVSLAGSTGSTATAEESVTVTTNLGSVGITAGVAVGKSVTFKYTAGSPLDLLVFADGTAGTATISVSTPSVTFAAKSVTFYSTTATKLTVLSATTVLATGTNTATALGVGVIWVKATDTLGNTVIADADGNSGVFAYSSDKTVVSDSGTACAYNSTIGYHTCSLTGVVAGTATITIKNLGTNINTATVAGDKTVAVTVVNTNADKLKIAFDKTSYAPGEKGYIKIWAVDSTGKVLSAGTRTNLITSSGIVLSGSFSGTTTPTSLSDATIISPVTAARVASVDGCNSTDAVMCVTFFAPYAGTSMTITATGGALLPAANQVAVTATASVADSGAAALAAVTALATTVASLKTLITTLTNLVLKIQKKVKA